MRPSGIGGQAVIEGVMMKNQDVYAIAVRKPDQDIEVRKEEYHSIRKKYSFMGFPIIRGVVSFVESMVIGMKTLTYSASFYEEEEESRESAVEKTMGKVFKDKAEAVIMALTVVLSIVLAIGIFMILPFFAAQYFKKSITDTTILALIEGLIRITIFVAYVVGISFMKDIKRVFMYHGAEHKTINCVENGLPLTVENVRGQSRHHKRCGTSFLFIVMFVSILFFMFIEVDTVWLRMLLRILLVPVIAGVSFEFIRLAGSSENGIVNLLSKPGMWLQSLTTREPDDSMIEVAIASVEAVFDWKKFQEREAEEESIAEAENQEAAVKETASCPAAAKETEKKEKAGKVKVLKMPEKSKAKARETDNSNEAPVKKNPTGRPAEVIAIPTREELEKKSEGPKAVIRAKKLHKETSSNSKGIPASFDVPGEEEEDEILRALDRFFIYEEEDKEP